MLHEYAAHDSDERPTDLKVAAVRGVYPSAEKGLEVQRCNTKSHDLPFDPKRPCGLTVDQNGNSRCISNLQNGLLLHLKPDRASSGQEALEWLRSVDAGAQPTVVSSCQKQN